MKQTRSKTRPNARRDRGVSPIIATILLVAITVVLAAVLYILVIGIGPGNNKAPIAVTLAESQVTSCDGVVVSQITIAGATGALTTGNFGLNMAQGGQGVYFPPGTAGAKSTTACGVAPPATGWDAELLGAGGNTQLAYFDAAGWHQWNATTYPSLVQGGEVLVIVFAPGVAANSQVVGFYGTNGYTVSGQATI